MWIDFKPVQFVFRDGVLQEHSIKSHFRGCAREVIGYLLSQAQKTPIHGKPQYVGFVFARIGTIQRSTKQFSRKDADGNPRRYSIPQIKRVLKCLRRLGVIGKYRPRLIGKRVLWGWDVYAHDVWAETHGHICDFQAWEDYEPDAVALMGNLSNAKKQEQLQAQTIPQMSPEVPSGDAHSQKTLNLTNLRSQTIPQTIPQTIL